MTAEIRDQAHRRDRWVSWIVIGVFIAALLLGWAVKAAAEGRTDSFDGQGLRTDYPAGWVVSDVQSPILFQAEDRWAAPFRTTLTLQRQPLPPNVGNPVGAARQNLMLERGQSLIAYRVLQTNENVTLEGHTGMRETFAYVETNPNPFLETAPVVMRGEDFFLPAGDKVYIMTVTAAEANYPQAQKAMKVFLRSLQITE